MNVTDSTNDPIWKNEFDFQAKATLSEKIGHIFNCFLAIGFVCRVFLGKRCWKVPKLMHTAMTLLIVRKALAILSGFYIYEATRLDKTHLRDKEEEVQQELKSNGLNYEGVCLDKLGIAYAAARVTHADIQSNQVWALHAVGVSDAMELHVKSIAEKNKTLGINTLIINGPQVVNSGGLPSRYHLGAAYEAGLQYLEKVIKANKIILHGYSFGGGTLAEAVLNHDFTFGKEHNISYLFISDRTFSDLQSIAAHRTYRLVASVLNLVDMQLDGMACAKRLTDLNIRHIIIQGEQDSDLVIPDCVSLAKALKDKGIVQNKVLITSQEIEHGKPLPNKIDEALKLEIEQFVKPPQR